MQACLHTSAHISAHTSAHTHQRTHTCLKACAQTDKDFSKYQFSHFLFCQTTRRHRQLHLFAGHWFHNQFCCAMPGCCCCCCCCFFQSCRRSSSGSSSLQLKPCVVEKQALVCGGIACLEWEGACRLQRSQSEHANSSWPSHTPCWRMHLSSQSGLAPKPPSQSHKQLGQDFILRGV